MGDDFRFSLPKHPEGVPVSAEEAERILREKVAAETAGSREHREALWQLVRFLGVTGRGEEGLEVLDRLLVSSVEPEEQARLLLGMGRTMERLDDFHSALTAYSRGVALHPVDPATTYFMHNNLGYCLNQLGRHAEAEHVCREAIRIDPLRYNAHKNLGLACHGQGRCVEAARSLIRAVQCEAGDPRALGHLEALAEAHPEIAAEIPDLREQLENCAGAVTGARLARMQLLLGTPPKTSAN